MLASKTINQQKKKKKTFCTKTTRTEYEAKKLFWKIIDLAL